jgi:Protein of unknown function with PCYCGC motif
MKGQGTILLALTLGGAVALLTAANAAAPTEYRESMSQSQDAGLGFAQQKLSAKPEGTHAYHDEPPSSPLPPTLGPQEVVKQLLRPDRYAPAAIVLYSIVPSIRNTLYQVPCYCGCDKSKGHQSLFDCFTTFHGAACPTCQMEAIYVFEQVKAGKKPAEIRAAMEKGEWGANVAEYVKKHYDEYVKPDRTHPQNK